MACTVGERGGTAQHRSVVIASADQHHADRQVVRAAARNADRRMAAGVEWGCICDHVKRSCYILLT